LVLSIALGAAGFLLFALEPMVGKMVLPIGGGTPGVWNACLFFFQAAFLAGALYARSVTLLANRTLQVAIHLALLLVALRCVPISIAAAPVSPDRELPFVLLGALVGAAAVPTIALSATTPLLMSLVARGRVGDPYRLYVASNAGSLAGLLAYPVLVEPRLGLAAQSTLWAAGFGALAVMVVAAALATRPAGTGKEPTPARAHAPGAGERIRWLVLAMVPASLTLGVTAYLSADVAAGPLLWVVPLALYLASWIVAFGDGRLKRSLPPRALLLFATPLLIAILTEASAPALLVIALHLGVFFLAALGCHRRLAAERPEPARAAEFHLWIAFGGAAGGLLNALVAPLVFSNVSEYPLAILAACALAGGSRNHSITRTDLLHAAAIAALTLLLASAASLLALPPGRGRTLVVFLAPALLAYGVGAQRPPRFALGLAAIVAVAAFLPGAHGDVVAQARSFFGVVRITRSGPIHTMVHGRTVHGRQSLEPGKRERPLAYYDPDGPVGSLFAARTDHRPDAQVGAIGLGTGAIAAYARHGEKWTFYEIDPAVVRFATDPAYFTFLRDAPSRHAPRIVVGDGRLRLVEAEDSSLDLLVVDAFGSDAIPTHLLTRERAGRPHRAAPGWSRSSSRTPGRRRRRRSRC
jgi:hypothetical protein